MLLLAMARPRSSIDQKAVAAAFAPDGLHGVSAGEVAERAGIAKPTLYAYGKSKDAVFLACVEAEIERLVDRLYAAGARTREAPLSARASAIALAIIDHSRADPAAFRLLNVTARHTTSSVAQKVDDALDRIPTLIAGVLRRDVPRAEDGSDPAMTLALALHGAAVAMALDPPWRRAERDRLAALVGAAIAHVVAPDGEPDDAGATDVGIY